MSDYNDRNIVLCCYREDFSELFGILRFGEYLRGPANALRAMIAKLLISIKRADLRGLQIVNYPIVIHSSPSVFRCLRLSF